MGVGLGSEILLDYSLNHKDNILCLLLSNVHRNSVKLFEKWEYIKMILCYKLGLLDRFYDMILNYHYTPLYLKYDENTKLSYLRELKSNQIESIYMQLLAYYNREYVKSDLYNFQNPLPVYNKYFR